MNAIPFPASRWRLAQSKPRAEPQSWMTKVTRSCTSRASSSASRWRRCSTKRYEPGPLSGSLSESPIPIRSGAMQRPRGCRCGNTLRQWYDEVGLPCSSTMGSPSPTSTYAISLPRTRRRCFWYGNAAEIMSPSPSPGLPPAQAGEGRVAGCEDNRLGPPVPTQGDIEYGAVGQIHQPKSREDLPQPYEAVAAKDAEARRDLGAITQGHSDVQDRHGH